MFYGARGVLIFLAIWKAAQVWEWAPRGTLPDPSPYRAR
ncbi:hypothetical protein D555_0934 [Bordetella holmesii 35009]|nr:hypothetical protein D555_0934 [Bordetella holmesii 35009]